MYWVRLLTYEILRLGVLWRQSKLSCCQIRVSSVYRLSCRSVATGLKKIGRTSWKLQILTCWKVIIFGAPATCSDLFRALSAWVWTSFQPFIIFFKKNSNPKNSLFHYSFIYYEKVIFDSKTCASLEKYQNSVQSW